MSQSAYEDLPAARWGAGFDLNTLYAALSYQESCHQSVSGDRVLTEGRVFRPEQKDLEQTLMFEWRITMDEFRIVICCLRLGKTRRVYPQYPENLREKED
ncbi:hypothetical protein [Rhodohalobacter barkolensis]|uniref:Uncharacterized protein n=1 Tax=Rhodohalobacter barkolensis TaxID=2053187 RepID=A0A2N0VIR2_9BACT|nr:hypothetical protein [Rhodohalobacter barkolensis]PKD44018.1 hypothetical protein CWD77_00635 [Rhodohalobacter barkolensis]